jgi:hypothetical protein
MEEKAAWRAAYSGWLDRNQKDGTLPSEEEMNKAMGNQSLLNKQKRSLTMIKGEKQA